MQVRIVEWRPGYAEPKEGHLKAQVDPGTILFETHSGFLILTWG